MRIFVKYMTMDAFISHKKSGNSNLEYILIMMNKINGYFIPQSPNCCIGWGASERLATAILNEQPDKILFVVDPVLEKISSFHTLLDIVGQTRVPYDIYTDVIPEPTIETGKKLVASARAGNYTMVIGVGGGSALDLAKLAAVFVKNEGELNEYLNLTGSRRVQDRGVFSILIPTTSGTGSEVTDISVLSLGHTKDVITHPYLQADLAIVDPKLTISVPSPVTATTGADALTHAVEAYLSVNSNPYSDTLALEAIRLIADALPKAVKDGNDKDARIAMSYGSYFAGIAFYNAGVGAVHALAYPLGGKFHIAHGDSNAVMLPYVLGYIHRSCVGRLSNILGVLNGQTAPLREGGSDAAHQALACVDRLGALMKEIGIPQTLQDFGIPETALRALAIDGAKQQRLLARCPMELDEEAIYSIYSAAFYGVSP